MKNLFLIFSFALCLSASAQLNGPAIDPFRHGTYEDGSSTGALEVRLKKGELVKVPFISGRYNAGESYGGASYQYYQGFLGGSTSVGYWNADGSSSGIHIICPVVDNVGTNVSGGQHIAFTFQGPAFGLRWIPNWNNCTNEFGVMIDGVSYRVENVMYDLSDGSVMSISEDLEHDVLITSDLSVGTHQCDLYFPAPNSGSSGDFVLLGYLASRLAGYEDSPRYGAYMIGGLLTTSLATIYSGAGSRAPAALFYLNTDSTSGQTVTLNLNGNDVQYLYLSPKGVLGDSQSFDFGIPTFFENKNAGQDAFTHKATTNAVVRWFGTAGQ